MRLNRRQLGGALLEELDIVHRHALRIRELHATLRDALRIHLKQRGPELGNALLDGPLRPRAEGDHRDHGPNADDDAEHGQGRAQFVRPQRCKSDLKDFEEPWRVR